MLPLTPYPHKGQELMELPFSVIDGGGMGRHLNGLAFVYTRLNEDTHSFTLTLVPSDMPFLT